MSHLHPLRCSTSSNVSLKAWLINEITSHQRHNFDKRTNQGTSRLLSEKIQHWYWKSSHKQSTLSQRADDATRESLEMIIFTPSSELTSDTCSIIWIVCEIIQYLWIIQVAFKIKVVSKMLKKLFIWNQGWFQVNLDFKVKFMIFL